MAAPKYLRSAYSSDLGYLLQVENDPVRYADTNWYMEVTIFHTVVGWLNRVHNNICFPSLTWNVSDSRLYVP